MRILASSADSGCKFATDASSNPVIAPASKVLAQATQKRLEQGALFTIILCIESQLIRCQPEYVRIDSQGGFV